MNIWLRPFDLQNIKIGQTEKAVTIRLRPCCLQNKKHIRKKEKAVTIRLRTCFQKKKSQITKK